MNKIILALISVLIMDYVYFSVFGKKFVGLIEMVQKRPFELCPGGAIGSYLMLVFALYYFILRERRGVKDAFVLGFVIYMIYELTNKAIFADWTWEMVVIDGLWGGILFASVAWICNNV